MLISKPDIVGHRFKASATNPKHRFSIVLKADTAGTQEAVITGLETIHIPDVRIEIIHAGTGRISKSDLLMAETGSRMIVGFNVEVLPGIHKTAAEKGIEIRLYDVIYTLISDIRIIADTLPLQEKEEEKITGSAKVIALFRGGDKGIILGCDVHEGSLRQGDHFRLISVPGIVFVGRIESLHIENREVKTASRGQQVGLKIPEFKRAKVGDLVECFQTLPARKNQWRPHGGVSDLRSNPNH